MSNVNIFLLLCGAPFELGGGERGHSGAPPQQQRREEGAQDDPCMRHEHLGEARPEEHGPPDGDLARVVGVLAPVVEARAHKLALVAGLPLEPVLLEVRCTSGPRIDRDIPNIQDYFLGLFQR